MSCVKETHVDLANERVQASDTKAQLILHEQTQRLEMLMSELRQALKAITDQDVANTRAAAEMEVQLKRTPGDKASSCRAGTSLVYVYRQT